MTSRIIVYGGNGALGSTCVKHFKSQGYVSCRLMLMLSQWVCAMDFTKNDQADETVVIKPSDSLTEQSKQVLAEAERVLGSNKVDAIVCVAGGWAGGNVASADFVQSIELVTKQSIFTSVIAAQVAAKHGAAGALLVLTGADAALKATPSMIGYGMVKAAVHQLTASLAKDSSLPTHATRNAFRVTLDTPMNRKFMPEQDTSSWTPMEYVSELLVQWVQEPVQRPESGALVRLHTSRGTTEAKVILQE
ncbi:hypothetical protein Ciccas_008940 [Cichlidogyrus casuarinus]|uniref:Dihydropteridine reductase n=1 Tax=Cichlidogyrus casuarinus TaxID=1844966 RepID=A0ABD2PYG6_9PLAT